MEKLNTLVDNIYVINMEKDKKRLELFNNRCNNLFRFERIIGVDVETSEEYNEEYIKWKYNNQCIETITRDTFDWKLYVNNYQDLQECLHSDEMAWNHWNNYGKKELRSCTKNFIVNKNQWGCLKSHIKIIEDAIEREYKTILILEDDAIFHKDFDSTYDSVHKIQNNCPNWNLIYLGASQHNWNNISMDMVIERGWYTPNNTTGTFGYMINHTFFKILLDLWKKMLKPVDNYLIDLQYSYYDTMFVLYPNKIVCNLEESNIHISRNNNTWFQKFKWDINNYQFTN